MTEKSWFWDYDPANPIGDSQADYDEDEYQNAIALMFLNDKTVQGPVFTRSNPFFSSTTAATGADCLTPSNPAGNTVRISPGVGIAEGAIYVNTADVDITVSGTNYYRIVMRKSQTGGTDKTVRLFSSSNGLSYPALTQSATTWDVPICRAHSSAGVVDTLIDDRQFVNNNIFARSRAGGHHLDWNIEGVSTYAVPQTTFQCGVTVIDGTSTAVRFPRSFAFAPVVFANPYNYSGGSPTHSQVVNISDLTKTGFTINVNSTTNITGYNWVAFGTYWDESV